MMAALYMMTLGLSSVGFGVFTYEVMSRQGFVPGSSAGLMIAAAGGCLFAGSQGLYITFVRLLHPTRDWAPFTLDMASHFTVLLLVPYILEWRVAWPHPILEQVAPVVYLAAFAGAHGVLKLVSYFAFVSGRPAGRLGSLGWAALTAVVLYGGWQGYTEWLAAFTQATPEAPEGMAAYRIGDTHAEARVVPEGVTVEYPVSAEDMDSLTFRFALPPGRPEGAFDDAPLVHVNMSAFGSETDARSMRLRLQPDEWGQLRLSPDNLPPNPESVQLVWTYREDPPWQRFMPFRPLIDSERALLVSGPYTHRARQDETPPNVVLIAVDSLGADHMSHFGYRRATTPNLDRLARERLAYSAAYTPAPDANAASMTLLTGLRPERHAFYGTNEGELPSGIPTLAERFRAAGYATAAFTEAEGDRVAVMNPDSPAARGFTWFDPSYRRDAQLDDMEAGSQETLDKAREFMQAHADIAFFMFIRIRELNDLRPRPRYGNGFMEANALEPDPRDIYDTALAYIDAEVGGFVQEIREHDFRTNTAVIVAGTHGLTFRDGAAPGIGLTEPCLRVPILTYILGAPNESVDEYVGLEDVAPTLMAVAGLQQDERLDGADLLAGPRIYEPIAMQRDPLAWSMRAEKWRSVWMPAPVPEEERFALYDLNRRPPQDRARYNDSIVQRHRQQLYVHFQQYQTSLERMGVAAAWAGAR